MVDFWSVFFFIIGTVFGSFFIVVGLRLPLKQDFIKGKSACNSCHKELSWLELIPIISYCVQGGKCRSCGHSLSFIYPVMEFTSGFLFLLAFKKFDFQMELIIALLFISLSVIITVADLRYMLIPNSVLLFYLPLFIFLIIITSPISWQVSVSGALSGFLLIGIIIFLSNGGMGEGDMKLLALIGLILGLKKVLLTFFIAVCLGSLVGIILLSMKRIYRKQRIPFAPYLLTGALLSYFYGNEFITLYVGLTGGSFSL